MNLRLAENLRRLRQEHGMTQQELADRLCVSYQAVSRWENRSSYPDIELLPALAALFGVTVDYLLGSAEQRAGREWWDAYKTLDTPSERLAHLRQMHRTFPDDQEVFLRLCEHTSDPEEALRLSEEFLAKCTIPFFRTRIIEHMITVLEDDRIMHYMWEKNIPEAAWDKLLEKRYLARGEVELYRKKREQLTRDSLQAAFARMTRMEGEPLSADVAGERAVLAVISTLTGTHLTEEHPVAGDGEVDGWESQRVWTAFGIAKGLAFGGDMAEALRYLEDAADLVRRLRATDRNTVISYRTPGMHTLDRERSRWAVRYDRGQVEAIFGDAVFDALHTDPTYAARFEACREVFLDGATN